jgi:16S rRNA (cytidine1402-2'-O)-methyltransferase
MGGDVAAKAPLAPGLYLVATPIGNLEDMTLRGLRILASVDRIACEDTRQTRKLLDHYGIATPTLSYHMHNETGRAAELTEALTAGGRIAVVSDAGTPGIADPGVEIVRTALAAGVTVYPIPGANAALSALIASGLPTEQFRFHGFLPSKEGSRRTVLEVLRGSSSTLQTSDPGTTKPTGQTDIFYETPHRILDALADIIAILGPQQPVVLARELTKLHEEFLRGTAEEVLATLAGRERQRGEMVLLLGPQPASTERSAALSIAEAVAALVRNEQLSEKDALKRIAKERGLGKSDAYREWQRGSRKR